MFLLTKVSLIICFAYSWEKIFFFFELHERKNTSAPEKFLPTLSTIYITHFLLDWISMTQSFHIQ